MVRCFPNQAERRDCRPNGFKPCAAGSIASRSGLPEPGVETRSARGLVEGPAAVFAVAFSMLLGSCTFPDHGGGAGRPLDVPDHWQVAARDSAPVEDGWLRKLDMPALEPLVAEMLQANADLGVAATRLEQALLALGIERGARLPTLAGSFKSERTRTHQPAGGGGRDAVDTDDFRLTLDVAWEVDLWGRIRANEQAAAAALDAARHDYDAARLSLAAQTAQLFVELTAARTRRDLAEKRVASFEQTLSRIRKRYQRGLNPALDMRLVSTELATAKADLADDANQLGQAARALEIILGRYPRSEIDGLSDLPPLRRPVPAGLPATLLERRPDIAAQRDRLLAAGYRISAARAELLPRLSLTASAGRQGEEFRNLFDPDFLVATIAANLVQPIFQGGRLRGAVATRRAQGEELLQAYSGQALLAFREVEDALDAESWLERREQALTTALAEASAAERLAEARYERGLAQILELLTAQQERLDAERLLLDVRRRRLGNRIALHLALGGDFAPTAAAAPEDARGTDS